MFSLESRSARCFPGLRLGKHRDPLENKTFSLGTSNKVNIFIPPTQIRFPIRGERVTCRGSNLTDSLRRTKLTNSLGKQQTCSLKPQQICGPAGVKQTISFHFFVYFELGPSMFPSASPRGKLRVSSKQNSLFPLGLVIKCFVIYLPTKKMEKNCKERCLLEAGWLTNLPRSQGARPDHVRVESSSCFPRELVSFDPQHVTKLTEFTEYLRLFLKLEPKLLLRCGKEE